MKYPALHREKPLANGMKPQQSHDPGGMKDKSQTNKKRMQKNNPENKGKALRSISYYSLHYRKNALQPDGFVKRGH